MGINFAVVPYYFGVAQHESVIVIQLECRYGDTIVLNGLCFRVSISSFGIAIRFDPNQRHLPFRDFPESMLRPPRLTNLCILKLQE